MILKTIKKKFFILIGCILFSLNLNAMSNSFEANFILKETANNGNIIFSIKENITFSNGKIDKKIKYDKTIKKMIEKIIVLENKYKNEDLFFVETIDDENKRVWTLSVTIMSKDTSVSQFVLKDKNNTISGWINRNNKDIFGLRLFNF